MEKEQALKLIGDLAQASTRHYRVVNGHAKGSAGKAADEELKAAGKLFKKLAPEEVLEGGELGRALGW